MIEIEKFKEFLYAQFPPETIIYEEFKPGLHFAYIDCFSEENPDKLEIQINREDIQFSTLSKEGLIDFSPPHYEFKKTSNAEAEKFILYIKKEGWPPLDSIYNPEFVKKLFDSMSSSYERMNYITSFGFSIRWRTQFLNTFQHKPDKVEIIDLLTGMGETWKATKEKLPNSQLTVLDFSEGMLRYAEKKNKIKFKGEIIILHQDVLQNQLPSDHYDFVTCAFGLKTFDEEQIKTLARETKRILKVGGQCSFIEVSKPENRVLKMFYGFYIGNVIPVLGKLLLGHSEEYKMLGRYTNKFGNAKKAAELFRKEGLNVQYHSYFYGCATGFTGTKKAE